MISSPLEQFEVIGLITLTAPIIGNFVLSLTNLGVYCILVVTIIFSLHILANNKTLIPNNWSFSLESIYTTVQSIVREQIGVRYDFYTPFIFSIFWFLLVANLCGNVPYGYTVTTSAVVAIGLSISNFLAITIIAVKTHKLHWFSFFVPENTPIALVPLLSLIEIVSYCARAVSLGVRLFANMVAGHTLLKILSTFLAQLFMTSYLVAIITLIPFTIFVALCGLELAVSLIQSYVFIVLISSYLKDAHELH